MKFLDAKKGQHPFELGNGPRPNMVVVTMDMVPPEFYRQPSSYLDVMYRPTWRAVEAEGVVFENAFSVSPLCGPSRAALFTGRYPYILVNEERAHDGSAVELRPDDAIYPEYLRAAGYVVAHVGKSHVGTAKFIQAFGENCSPWNRWAPPVWDDAEYHQYLSRLGVSRPRFSRVIEGQRHDRRTAGNNYGGWVEQSDGRPFPIEATYPHYLVDRALAFLDSLLDRAAGRAPVYLHVDFFAPHQPFMIPAGLEDREAALREHVVLPASFTEWVDSGYRIPPGEPKIYELYRRSLGLYDPAVAREYILANLLQMEVVERAIERLVGRLRELGLWESGLFLLSADHGEMNTELGLVDKGVYGHPKAARVPLVLKLPDGAHAGKRVAEPVSLLDVAPTLLELAGTKPLARLDGESLFRRLGPGAPPSRPFLYEMGWHVAPNPAVAIHLYRGPAEHYRYVYNLTSEHDELYDLNDPEYRNRIGEPGLAEVRAELLRRLAAFLSADPRWRCYWHTLRLDKADELPVVGGDQQMFIPEEG